MRGDALAARSLGRREDHGELEHAPRPDAEDHLAQVAVVLHLHNSNVSTLGHRSVVTRVHSVRSSQ